MAISQVITFDGSPDELVWKYDSKGKYKEDFITTTSRLIVDETHEALLVVNGAAADLFGPGSHTLSLPNIPILNKIISIPTGGENPFPCKVFFVNKVHHLDLFWGTQGAPIAVEDPDYHIFLHVMLHGSVAFSISDSRKFLLKLVGFRSNFGTKEIVDNFKTLISSHVKDCISKIMINGRVGFFQMNANLMEVSSIVKERLDQIFDEYGIALQYFNIESIDVPEKDLIAVKAAKERRAGRIIEGYTWQEEKQMDIAKTFAGNEGNMGAMGGMVGGMMGGAMMGGTISELARTAMSPDRIPTQAPPHSVGAVSPMAPPPAQNLRAMMEAGAAAAPAQEPPASPAPGAQAPGMEAAPAPAGKFCKDCGTPLAPEAKFCFNCGAAQANNCPACGAQLPSGAKFCSNCGQRL